MRFRSALVVALLAASLLSPGAARGWEAETTNAGLTEAAALHSKLHHRLVEQFGAKAGLYQRLTIPPQDAPQLFSALRRLNPTHGYVADGKGRALALGWLVAGAAVADTPTQHAANHFFDPATKQGLSDKTLTGMRARLRHRLGLFASGQKLPRRGHSAVAWLTHADNPMSYQAFAGQYAKAIGARTQGERDRHLAGALLAAGAIVHVIEDVGSPSHARNDLAAHLQKLGGAQEVGSRYERVAALAYGRLGIPTPSTAIERDSLAAFVHGADGKGLADITASSWFSAGTMPRDTRFARHHSSAKRGRTLARALVRPTPAISGAIDPRAAATDAGGTVRTAAGICLANYFVENGWLQWFTSDTCTLEQLAVQLPTVGAYASGALDYLFRGSLKITTAATGPISIASEGVAVGAGTLSVLWQDKLGVRTELIKQDIGGGPASAGLLAAPAAPETAVAIAALFIGVDGKGQPLVAAGTQSLTAK